jgi:hypothetical protein
MSVICAILCNFVFDLEIFNGSQTAAEDTEKETELMKRYSFPQSQPSSCPTAPSAAISPRTATSSGCTHCSTSRRWRASHREIQSHDFLFFINVLFYSLHFIHIKLSNIITSINKKTSNLIKEKKEILHSN